MRIHTDLTVASHPPQWDDALKKYEYSMKTTGSPSTFSENYAASLKR
jgi:hypothetical protein